MLGDGLVGVDLDECRDSENGTIDPNARTIITKLDSYTELSPSRKGVHILLHGALPRGRRRKGTVEMYEHARYFTVTGAHLPTIPTTIEDRTAALATVHAELFSTGSNGDRSAPTNQAVKLKALDGQDLLDLARSTRKDEAFSLVYPGFPTIFRGLSEFFVGDLMGKALWKLVENAQRFPRRGGRVLCVHGPVSFHRARPCATKWPPRRGLRTGPPASSDCGRP